MLILIPLAYLFGSISSAVLVCRAMGLADPRGVGSGNPGATNVLRVGGKLAAGVTLAGDVAKGLVTVLVAAAVGADSAVIAACAAAAFLGHLYPVFFSFQGGKGVATAAGVFFGLDVALGAAVLLVWLGAALVFRYSSAAALSAAAAAPALVFWLLPESAYFLMSLMLAGLLCWRHRENIRRLMAGEESKIKFSRN